MTNKLTKNRIRDALTPEAIDLIGAVDRTGSMAAAARELGLVPSALTYRIRQVEDALDVLLFDRSSRQAKLTEAGAELLREGNRLLGELDALANRVKRVATGWEPVLTLAIDGVIQRHTVMELCEAFFALNPPTRLRLREETLSGTLEALTSGQADLALGVAIGLAAQATPGQRLQSQPLGALRFVYAVAPHHPLAALPNPLTADQLMPHRVVAVADSVQRGRGMTVGLMGGQDIFTVPNMTAKLEAQLRGLGGGFLPDFLARPHIDAGRLVEKAVVHSITDNLENTDSAYRTVHLSYAWMGSPQPGGTGHGRALQWWLTQLGTSTTRRALLQGL